MYRFFAALTLKEKSCSAEFYQVVESEALICELQPSIVVVESFKTGPCASSFHMWPPKRGLGSTRSRQGARSGRGIGKGVAKEAEVLHDEGEADVEQEALEALALGIDLPSELAAVAQGEADNVLEVMLDELMEMFTDSVKDHPEPERASDVDVDHSGGDVVVDDEVLMGIETPHASDVEFSSCDEQTDALHELGALLGAPLAGEMPVPDGADDEMPAMEPVDPMIVDVVEPPPPAFGPVNNDAGSEDDEPKAKRLRPLLPVLLFLLVICVCRHSVERV
jgi:hypothetical protein